LESRSKIVKIFMNIQILVRDLGLNYVSEENSLSDCKPGHDRKVILGKGSLWLL
jgi:hypothetical protein